MIESDVLCHRFGLRITCSPFKFRNAILVTSSTFFLGLWHVALFQAFLSHAVAGLECLIDTAIETAETGNQCRLIGALEDPSFDQTPLLNLGSSRVGVCLAFEQDLRPSLLREVCSIVPSWHFCTE